MTAEEFRKQGVSNTRLAWEIHGHKVPIDSLEDFSSKELEDILLVETDEEIKKKINEILSKRYHWM